MPVYPILLEWFAPDNVWWVECSS